MHAFAEKKKIKNRNVHVLLSYKLDDEHFQRFFT